MADYDKGVGHKKKAHLDKELSHHINQPNYMEKNDKKNMHGHSHSCFVNMLWIIIIICWSAKVKCFRLAKLATMIAQSLIRSSLIEDDAHCTLVYTSLAIIRKHYS